MAAVAAVGPGGDETGLGAFLDQRGLVLGHQREHGSSLHRCTQVDGVGSRDLSDHFWFWNWVLHWLMAVWSPWALLMQFTRLLPPLPKNRAAPATTSTMDNTKPCRA